MLSVIIPVYNSEATLSRVLNALFAQKDIAASDFEIIVVDDCSRDNSVKIASGFSVRIKQLEKNSGPAVARNEGAKAAAGDILIFVDSDVVLKDDALSIINKNLARNPDIAALCGIYAKEAAREGIFYDYLALRKYSNWFDPKREFISFLVVSLGAIKKNVFLEFGGFNTRYRGADVEDFELGYRITEKYKILLVHELQGYHYFPAFSKTIKNFFKRSFQWTELFMNRKKFSTEAATTKKRGIGNLSGFLSFIFFIASLWVDPLRFLAYFMLLVFLVANLKFYVFVLKEKGAVYLFYAAVLDYIFAQVTTTAAGLSLVKKCLLSVIRK